MRCPSCGAIANEDARFCARCGAPLAAPDPTAGLTTPGRSPQAAPVEAGDRRIVTALFADLVDYVRMLAEHDPEDVRARVTAALMTMASAIERFEGTREKFIGDAVFAVFGWPRTHDDDAVRAALAALAIRSGLQEAAAGGEPLDVRIGLATGEVVAGAPSTSIDRDLRLTGEAITTAARIQSMARPGEILLDEATLRAARGRLAAESRGAVVLRGQSNAVELHALRGEAGVGPWSAFRPASPHPIVGRLAELDTIGRLFERVRATNHGGAMLIEGEAGIGKTRLLQAVEAPARAAGFEWTWTENLSYARNEPYRWARMLAQVVADEHGLDSGTMARRLLFTDDVSESTRRRLGGAIAAIARDAAFSGWEAEAADIATDPAEVTIALVDVATRYLDRLLATTGPRVVVIDDLQWLDPSSIGMVELLIERCADHPLVVLAAARAGLRTAMSSRADVPRIRLTGLDEPDTARLATLVARAAVDVDGARSIHERTGGNPLFVRETVRAFLEDGTLQWRDGLIALTATGGSRVPITLRAILGARIDALPWAAREALGVASVIGIVFRVSTVEALLDRPFEPDVFEDLAASSLVQPHDDRWRFAHWLIHDATYAGLLASRRRALHARLADLLDAGFEPTTPSQIAAHRVAAGETALAIPLLREAAENALALGAVLEAAAFWRQAADLAAPDDPRAAEDDRTRAADALAALDTNRDAVAPGEAAAAGSS